MIEDNTHDKYVCNICMENVLESDIDVENIFDKMIDKLMKKYGEKLLEINVQQVNNDKGSDRRQYA